MLLEKSKVSQTGPPRLWIPDEDWDFQNGCIILPVKVLFAFEFASLTQFVFPDPMTSNK